MRRSENNEIGEFSIKRKKPISKSTGAFERFTRLPVKKKRRLILKVAVSLGVLGVAAGAISGYDKKQRELHDLTSIGTGIPVVVQIHDTSCPDCRSLKSRSLEVLKNRSDVLFRIADVASTEGSALQKKYGVEKTTLLLFNAEGRRVDTVVGLQTSEALENLFTRSFPPMPIVEPVS